MSNELIDECRKAFADWTAGYFGEQLEHHDLAADWVVWQAAWNHQQETIYAMRSAWDAECPT